MLKSRAFLRRRREMHVLTWRGRCQGFIQHSKTHPELVMTILIQEYNNCDSTSKPVCCEDVSSFLTLKPTSAANSFGDAVGFGVPIGSLAPSARGDIYRLSILLHFPLQMERASRNSPKPTKETMPPSC